MDEAPGGTVQVEADLKGIERCLLIGDMHCGSAYGLNPQKWVLSSGIRPMLSEVCMWINHSWYRMIGTVKERWAGKPFVLVINSDTVHGAPKGDTELIDPDIARQPQMAIDLLTPLIEQPNCVHAFSTFGTPAHVGASAEVTVMEHFEKTYYDPVDECACWMSLDLDFNGHLMNVAHHMPVSGDRRNSAGPMSRIIYDLVMERAAFGRRLPDVVARAHSHFFRVYQDDRFTSIVSNAWQVRNRYLNKARAHIEAVTIGGVMLDWSERGQDDPPEVTALKYRQPTPKEIVL